MWLFQNKQTNKKKTSTGLKEGEGVGVDFLDLH